jgi:hypothetical protein
MVDAGIPQQQFPQQFPQQQFPQQQFPQQFPQQQFPQTSQTPSTAPSTSDCYKGLGNCGGAYNAYTYSR